jgi:formate hydrogenlyase subunit 3/multisubunit Na+/H+ antiporter MnhD subunit
MRRTAAAMFVIGVAMWAGVPGFWMWIGSIVYGPEKRLSLALIVMAVGAVVTIVALVKTLGTLNRKWLEEYEEVNQRKPARSPLEPVLVIGAIVALAIFGIWFMFFAGGGGSTVGPRG